MTKIAPQIASPAAMSCGNSAGPTWSPGIDGNPHAFQRIAPANTIRPAPTRESLNFSEGREARGKRREARGERREGKIELPMASRVQFLASRLSPCLLRHSEFLHE